MDDPTQLLAARLRERMVAGELPRERLQIGEALGHEASRIALGHEPKGPPGPWDPPTPPPSLERWGRSFGRFGPLVMLRLAVAIARELSAQAEVPELAPGLAAADRFLAQSAAQEAGAQDALHSECEAAAQEAARAALQREAEPKARRACLATLPLLRAILQILSDGAPERSLFDAHYVRVLKHGEPEPEDLERLQALVRDEVCAWAFA